jgi:hypothetical protein
MISDWVHHHELLAWLIFTPFVGLSMGWFGRTFLGLFGKHGNATLCAMSGAFWALFYLLYAWSASIILRGQEIELGTFFVRYIPMMLIAAAFSFWLAKRYGYDEPEPDDEDEA